MPYEVEGIKEKFRWNLNEQVNHLPDEAEDKISLIEKDMLLNKMKEAIKKLNPEQQQCVTLFYLKKNHIRKFLK